MNSAIGPMGMGRNRADETGISPTGSEKPSPETDLLTEPTAHHAVSCVEKGQAKGDLMLLFTEARNSISVVLNGNSQFDRFLLQLLNSASGSVRTRIMCTAEALEELGHDARQVLESCREVRVSEAELCGVLAVDSRAAVLHVRDRNSTEGQIARVNDAAAVRAFELLYSGAWSRSRHFTAHTSLAAQFRTDRARRMLEFLQAGRTDASAAREINMSLRTYRRHIAVIMRELEANSRFQAGARAAELGLL